MDYYAIVEEKVSKKMNIISCDDLFDFDLTWVNDSTQWPGAHQTSAKKKIARWFQNDEIIQGMVVDIGLHESVSTKLKSLVGREEEGGRGGSSNQDFLDLKKEIDLIKIQLNQLIRENNLLKQIHNENNQKFKYVGPSRTLIMYLDLMAALNHSSDVEGLQYLLRCVFGVQFEAEKKTSKLHFDEFPEKNQIKEIICKFNLAKYNFTKCNRTNIYFVHCKTIVESNPDLKYGSQFPDYPVASLNAVTAGNGQEVPQRARKLVASYGRVFTNFYQNAGKSEEDRKRKNLKEQERRKRAKLAKAQPPLNVGQDSSNPTDPSIPGNSGADSSSI
ncbi:hypothetical protein BLOT_006694 [Blomia tropicalis]|nr:hypothetical protein BLOT_006694 [Blomia tropicalis]